MRRSVAREAALLLGALVLITGISLAVFFVVRPGDGQDSGALQQGEDPALFTFEQTWRDQVADEGISLAVHTYRATPSHMAVLYSVVAGSGAPARLANLSLADDAGQTYEVRQHVLLGEYAGVAVGLLVTEPYKPGGSVLTLRSDGMQLGNGPVITGDWSLELVRNTQPDVPMTHYEDGRLSDEVVRVQDATIGVAGPPGGSFIEVLIYRGGTTFKVHGHIDPEGVARALGPAEFSQLLAETTGASGFPVPPGFPTAQE